MKSTNVISNQLQFLKETIVLTNVVSAIALFSVVNCDSNENFEIYKQIFNRGLLQELSEHIEENPGLYNITQCITDIRAWKSDFLKEKWPIIMLDSYGKIPPGLLSLNIQSYGQFDQCLSIDHFYRNDRLIKGKYCVAKIPIPKIKSIYNELSRIANLRNILPKNNGSRLLANDAFGRQSLIMAICLPHTCKMDEIETMLGNILENVGIPHRDKPLITIPENECVTAEPAIWTPTDWGALAFFIFFGILLLLSTGYDLIVKHFKKDTETSIRHDLLISFSIWTNTSKLFTINKNNSKSLKCLHGLRALSLMWVIIGHRYINYLMIPITNGTDILKWVGETGSMAIISGPFSVDTFFLLSGLLVAYISFRQLDKKQCFNFPLMYLHRFLRLTPALAAIVFFQASLSRYISNGPIWNTLTKDMIENCEKNWWTTLLYIQNYVNVDNLCVAQTWYLSCDMQLFILSPIIIYPLLRWRRVGWTNMIFWIVVSQISVFVVAYENEWNKNVNYAYGSQSYFMTHNRATPWLLGFALGYFIHLSTKSNIKINKVAVIVGWIACFVIMGAAVFGMKPMDKNSKLELLMYNSFAKTGWSIAVMWVIIACIYGYGGPINWFLSLEIWEIVGRLSYAMYLVHMFVQYSISFSTRHAIYFSNFNAVMTFFSDVVLTVFMGYLLSISFELPVMALEKIIFHKKKSDVMERKKASIPANLEIQEINVEK
ncbi:nose resistant to fluoxetine protein 6-like [Arctopsyche grandis]|uniref:nose resistant to fluoxetine protein 6-like n=1 Tax=Arctopsyche grandis TaxID=121162 RepID=UPI00406D8A28